MAVCAGLRRLRCAHAEEERTHDLDRVSVGVRYRGRTARRARVCLDLQRSLASRLAGRLDHAFAGHPLPALHPAAVELSKAAVVAGLQGNKDVVLKLYTVEVDPREKDVSKILAAFNKTMKTNISPADIKSSAVMKHMNSDLNIANALMVNSTPTMFFDDKLDKTKRKFEMVK